MILLNGHPKLKSKYLIAVITIVGLVLALFTRYDALKLDIHIQKQATSSAPETIRAVIPDNWKEALIRPFIAQDEARLEAQQQKRKQLYEQLIADKEQTRSGNEIREPSWSGIVPDGPIPDDETEALNWIDIVPDEPITGHEIKAPTLFDPEPSPSREAVLRREIQQAELELHNEFKTALLREKLIDKAIEQLFQQVRTANIVFNTPEKIDVDETATIQLLLSTALSINTLEEEHTQDGTKISDEVKVTNTVEAVLEGANFTTRVLGPSIQTINSQDPTEWNWEVKPKAGGKQTIHLILISHVEIGGEKSQRMIVSYHKDIEVYVSPWIGIRQWTADNAEFIWTAMLIPLITWLRQKWKNREKTDSQKQPG